MGRDKALLRVGDETLLDRTIRILNEVTGDAIVVADSEDRYKTEVRIIPDLFPGAGPLGGIVTGLSAVGDGYHLVVACDLPRLRPEILRLIVVEAEGFDAAIPEVRGHLEPLCAAYHSRCAGIMKNDLSKGIRAVHESIRNLRARIIPEEEIRRIDPNLESFTNLNTPEEYAELLGR